MLTLCIAPTFVCNSRVRAWLNIRGINGCTGSISLWDSYEGSAAESIVPAALAPLREHPTAITKAQPLRPGGQDVFRVDVGGIGKVTGIEIGLPDSVCNWHLDTALLTLSPGVPHCHVLSSEMSSWYC